MNNKNKTILMSSIISMMLITGGITPVHAAPGDLLLTINNPTPAGSDFFGYYVATTNTGDILVSAYRDDTGATSAGSVYLFDGNDGSLLLTINNPTPETTDYFGHSVGTTPTGDLLIGADGDDTGASNSGIAYLFDGTLRGTTSTPLLTINNPTPDAGDHFGISIASTPTGNILVGAYGDDTGATSAGSAYLFDGNDGSLLLTINNPTPETYDFFGKSVGTTPTGDILIGASYDDTGVDNSGSAYLFDGNDGTLLLTINNPTPATDDYFGYSVATTNTGDILVSAYNDNTGATSAGFVYLFDGTDGSLLLAINNPTPAINDFFGYSVDTTPNGNILVGAYPDYTGTTYAGSVYLFDGNNGSLLLTINNPTPVVYDEFGYSVGTTPTGDILVFAYYDDTSATYAGSVYLFEGISSNTAPVIDPIPNQSVDENDSLFLLVNAYDTDLISFEISPSLNFITFTDNGDNTATFLANPGLADSGVYSFNVTATDEINNIWQVFTLTVNNIISPAPIITSLIVDDHDVLNDTYSVYTITITFNSDTNIPGGTRMQTTTAVDNLFTFSESLGEAYYGIWTTPDTFTITIKNANNVGSLDIGVTTVTPAGTTPILPSDGTSVPSYITSPVLSGDLGLDFLQINWIQLPLTDGAPLGVDCDGIEKYGRVILDEQDNTLYLCTASGWIAK